MQTLFQYNWKIRDEWFEWCKDVPLDELLRVRTGGVGGILHTLFHIIDAEWSWIRIMKGFPDFQESFSEYQTLDKVIELNDLFKEEVKSFVLEWKSDFEHILLQETRADGTVIKLAWGEVMRHVIAHEIHHIGQLSVWSREFGKPPVSANLIRKGLGVHLPSS